MFLNSKNVWPSLDSPIAGMATKNQSMGNNNIMAHKSLKF
jgi:hypothetical protein